MDHTPSQCSITLKRCLSASFLIFLSFISLRQPSHFLEETGGSDDGPTFRGVPWYERARPQTEQTSMHLLKNYIEPSRFSLDCDYSSLRKNSRNCHGEEMSLLNAEAMKILKSISNNIKAALPSLSMLQVSYMGLLLEETKTLMLEKVGRDLQMRAQIISTEAQKQKKEHNSFVPTPVTKNMVENGESLKPYCLL